MVSHVLSHVVWWKLKKKKIMTKFNERTNTLLYKKNIISHTLFLKGLIFLCVRDELETRTDCYIDFKFFFDHSSTSCSSLRGCSTVGHWGLKALSLQAVLTLAFYLQLTRTVCALVILLFNAHMLPLFFHLFTQAHLLIDGSVEGQYITQHLWAFFILKFHGIII